MGNGLIDSTIRGVNESLNLRLQDQNIINSNIANAETPGFKAKRLEFEQELRRKLGIDNQLPMQATEAGHVRLRNDEPIAAEIFDDPNGIENLDGNTVDRSQEMARLAENQLLYEAGVEVMRKKLGMIKYGINEGNGGR